MHGINRVAHAKFRYTRRLPCASSLKKTVGDGECDRAYIVISREKVGILFRSLWSDGDEQDWLFGHADC